MNSLSSGSCSFGFCTSGKCQLTYCLLLHNISVPNLTGISCLKSAAVLKIQKSRQIIVSKSIKLSFLGHKITIFYPRCLLQSTEPQKNSFWLILLAATILMLACLIVYKNHTWTLAVKRETLNVQNGQEGDEMVKHSVILIFNNNDRLTELEGNV